MELVVIIHGLMRTKWSMKKLEKFFKHKGYDTLNINYFSLTNPISKIALEVLPKSLNKKLKKKQYSKIHFVTHSLGGIITRYYFTHYKNIPETMKTGKIVMIAPPNKGAELAEKWRDRLWFKYTQGPAGQHIGTGAHSVIHQLNPLTIDVGIIAGNKPVNHLTALLLPSENDGTVTVESTKLSEMKDHITLPYNHTFICNKKVVWEQAHHFLENGSFFA